MSHTGPTLGSLPAASDGRDAIHVAVAPVVAAEVLAPGQHVGLQSDGRAGPVDAPIGIVDPFLSAVVEEGQRFWLVLYPNTITSLRHVWTHPEFAPKVPSVRRTAREG